MEQLWKKLLKCIPNWGKQTLAGVKLLSDLLVWMHSEKAKQDTCLSELEAVCQGRPCDQFI